MKRPRGKSILKLGPKSRSKLHIAGRFSRPQAIVFGLIFAALGGYVIHMSFAATVTCDLNATPSNFSSQVSATQPSQTLCLATGNYGTFTGVTKASPGITITAASGQSPVFNKFSFDTIGSPAWITFDSVEVKEAVISAPAHDITFKNSKFSGYTQINPGASPNANNACGNCPAMNNNNIVFDGDNFDLSACPDGSCISMEGRLSFAQVGPTPAGVTVKNSVFQNNCADGVQFGSAGYGVTIGPGNEFKNLNQTSKAPSEHTGDCGPHVDPIQFVGTSNPGPTITGNYFHDNSTGIASYDGTNQATITNNVIAKTSQDLILATGYTASSSIEHNTLVGGELMCGYTHDMAPCKAVIRNNIADDVTMVDAGGQPTVNDYNLCKSGCPGTHSITGNASFVGGANPTTWAGYALASGSPGKGAASDGTDMGATTFGPVTCNTTLSSGADVLAAAKTAASGSTICLNAGTYSYNATWQVLGAQKTSMTTIQPAPGVTKSQVTFTNIAVGDSKYITFTGVTIQSGSSGVQTNSPQHIRFTDDLFDFSDGNFTMYASDNTNQDFIFDSSEFRNFSKQNCSGCNEGRLTITANVGSNQTSTNGIVIKNSLFDNTANNACSDGIQVNGGAYGTQILNNEFTGILQDLCPASNPPHADPIQFYGGTHTTVSGNYFHNNSTGIMSPDANGSPFTVTNNVFVGTGGYPWAIVNGGGTNDVITHNTFVGWGVEVDKSNGNQQPSNVLVRDNIISGGIINSTGGAAVGTVQDHNLIPGASSPNIGGTPTYTGGANPTSYAGFALASNSAGKGLASDGTDVGAAVSGAIGGGSGDTTAPTVSLTAPTNGATVSGATVSVSASAADNVGVAGVQFKLDGANLGSEDTASPYSTTWNATTVSNGTHTLTAVARDAAGNTTTSSSVTVTVTGGTSVLVGNGTVESDSDSDSSGEAEAFKYTASGSGTAGSLKLYIASGSTASTVKVGIYSNASGHPGTLLASGTITSPTLNSWNSATLSPSATITSGTIYWIAILGTNGSLYYKDQSSGTCSEGTSAAGLTALATNWASGTTYASCSASAYVTAASSGGTTKIGDFNSDGVVNIYDMGIFLSKWLSTTAGTQDLNGDGVVNIYDLGVFLSHYGS